MLYLSGETFLRDRGKTNDSMYHVAAQAHFKDTLEAYHNDPYCTFTVNGFKNLLDLMKDCYSPKGWEMSNSELPVHFISGAEDPCRISDKAIGKAADLMRRVGYKNTDLHLYPGMRHEILNETNRTQVWEDILGKLA